MAILVALFGIFLMVTAYILAHRAARWIEYQTDDPHWLSLHIRRIVVRDVVGSILLFWIGSALELTASYPKMFKGQLNLVLLATTGFVAIVATTVIVVLRWHKARDTSGDRFPIW